MSNTSGTQSIPFPLPYDQPLAQDPSVRELMALLLENGKDTTDLTALLGRVQGMENLVRETEATLAQMKAQLESIEFIQNHPVKAMLTNITRMLEEQLKAMKEQLSALKQGIIEGCQSAVQTCKDKGHIVLDNLASFFRIEGSMEALHRTAGRINSLCERAQTRIDIFTMESRSAGQHLNNAFRSLMGRDPLPPTQEVSIVASILGVPYRACASLMTKLTQSTDRALTSLQRIGDRADTARKVPLQERLEAAKEKAKEQVLSNPVRGDRAKAMEVL